MCGPAVIGLRCNTRAGKILGETRLVGADLHHGGIISGKLGKEKEFLRYLS